MDYKNKNSDFVNNSIDKWDSMFTAIVIFLSLTGCAFIFLMFTGAKIVWEQGDEQLNLNWEMYDHIYAECIEREIDSATCELLAFEKSGL